MPTRETPASAISRALAPMEKFYGVIASAVAVTLMVSLVFSLWDFAQRAAGNEARLRFESRASQIVEAIRGRMVDYEQVLRGGVGLLAAAHSVDRNDWREYVGRLRVEDNYPGMQAVGYGVHVPGPGRARHELALKAAGYPRYAIRPPGERAEYAPVLFVEPYVGRNALSLGYDLLSDPARRAALERARDTDEAAISGPVTLAAEEGRDDQAGLLMCVAVYRAGAETGTPAGRRHALTGYVYGAFRAGDLMAGILGRLDGMRLRVYDAVHDREDLLYDSAPAAGPHEPAWVWSARLPMRGREWQVVVTSLPALEAATDRRRPALAAAAGGVIGTLLLVIMWSLATTRARAETLARAMTAELSASREQLTLAIEGSNQATFDWDVGSGRVVLSRQWARITGSGEDALVTTLEALETLVHPDDVGQVHAHVARLARGELDFYHAEHRVRTAAGAWRWISSRAKVVARDRDGRPTRVAGTNEDISERKEVERFKDEFVATVNHELRTPLTAIVGALGLLKHRSRGALAPDAAAFLDMAQQNSERLTALVNDILDVERLDAGKMEYRIEAVGLEGLLRRAVTLNAAYAERYRVRFELNEPLPAVRVRCDEQRVLQVLANLLSNAARFSPEGGAVAVSASAGAATARVSVADRGPGVPAEFRGRIFQRFAQADASDTRRTGGTGLGLAISRAIVEKLDGTIGFESQPGQGAVFWFELPLDDARAAG